LVLTHSFKERERERERERDKEREKKREWKKNKKIVERERKRGYIYIKKSGVRKEGRVSQLYTLWHYTSAKKTLHHLAPPNLALARLQSLAITPIYCQLCIALLVAPTHAKKRNAPLTIRGFATPHRLAHAHMQRKETYFAPPIPKHCAKGSCHQGLWFLHTSCVYDLALIIHLSRHGALFHFSLHHKEESSTTIRNHATAAAAPRHTFIYAAGKYTQVYAKVIQCSPILHLFLSPF